MRNVNRLDEPGILRRNARRWTKELLEAIAEAKRTNTEVHRNRWNRYNQPGVKERLEAMYSGLCCYCESRVGDVAHTNIEHRKPKRKFPDLTFAWTNLHLACPQCNNAKKKKWDGSNEILDAVADNPISDHLGYKVIATAVLRDPVTARGAVTINHADLNRDLLLESRQEVFNGVWETVIEIREKERKEGDGPIVRTAKSNLRRLFAGEHGSLIQFVATRVLDTISR